MLVIWENEFLILAGIRFTLNVQKTFLDDFCVFELTHVYSFEQVIVFVLLLNHASTLNS